MTQLSIFARLVMLCAALLLVLIGSHLFLTGRLSENAATLDEQSQLVSVIKTANAANKAYGDLKYWLAELAVSLLVLSERNAEEARGELDARLAELEPTDPNTVKLIRKKVAALMRQAMLAVEAYTENQRVLGNSLMARSRSHIAVIDAELAALVNRLEAVARDKGELAVQAARSTVRSSYIIIVVGAIIGLIIALLVLRSIRRPLGKLVTAMSSITEGDLGAEIPVAGRDEIGAMTRTLELFRDSQIERNRLAAEREQVQEALRRAQAQLLEAIEAVSEGFALYDADDRLVLCNSHYRQMYDQIEQPIEPGTSFESIIRAAVDMRIISDARGCEDEWIEQRLAGHREPGVPYEQARANDNWLRISEHKTQDGGIVGVFTDITEIKSRQAQLAELLDQVAEARDEAQQANEAKSQFLANMSHELRTPLNAVIGITEMLQEDAAELGRDDFLEPLDRITRAGKHLLHLINEILDLAKIEAGKIELFLEDFGIADLVRVAARTAETLAEKNGNRLVVDCAQDLGDMRADQTRVRQIVLNLLSNACKFTENGSVTLTAVRDRTDGADWLIITVADTGIGMRLEQMDRLFQEFSQADSTTTRKYGGTGLGLVISQRLCTLMGGDIDVTSVPGEGTTFMVRLPLAAATAKNAEPDDLSPALEAMKYTGLPLAKGGRRTTGMVLVIDDDATVRDQMRRYLAKEGFDVITAADGDEGLRLAKQMHPSVITLDVLMPGIDGWGVLQQLRADPELAGVPILMLTVLAEKKKGYALGASDYMTKPVNRDQLRALLDRYKFDDPGKRLLLVEDDVATRQIVHRLLHGEGWQVAEAENGRVALERLAEMRPTLILLDLLMPEMDGFEFLVELRKSKDLRDIPVIVMTAADLTDDDRRRLEGGAQLVLKKGAYDWRELFEELRFAVAQYPKQGKNGHDRI